MSKTQEQSQVKRLSWIIWILLVLLMILLASAFSRAWALHQALKEKEAFLEPLLTEQQETQLTLQAELTYAQSDTYVEEWALSHAGMTQPEETLVKPLIKTPTPTPIPTPTPSPTPTPAAFWQRWWQILIGN